MRVIDTYRTVMSLAYSPCGRFLYSAGWQHVSRWDVFSGKELELYRDRSATYLTNVQVSPSGGLIGWDDLARQRIQFGGLPTSVRSRQQVVESRVALNQQPTWSFLRNDAHVTHSGAVATNRSGTAIVYVTAARTYINHPLKRVKSGPLLGKGGVLSPPYDILDDVSNLPWRRFGFASESLLWYHVGADLVLHDLDTDARTRVENIKKLPIAVTPNGRTGIATVSREVCLIHLPSGQTRERFNWDVGTVEAVAIAPDGQTAAVAGWNGGIAIFDMED